MKEFTYEEQRLAIICFNHCYSQWVWNTAKLVLRQDGREAVKKHVAKECRHFGSHTPAGVSVEANNSKTGMVLKRGGIIMAELSWSRFADFVEQNRTCPKTTKEIDMEEDLMSVFNEEEDIWKLLT